MELVGVVLLLVTATYAINILKIRMVVRGRPFAAAALEGAQSFMYVYVLVRLVESANTGPGMVAYVVGASLGTLVATLVRAGGEVADHSHACCAERATTTPLLGPTTGAVRHAPGDAPRPGGR